MSSNPVGTLPGASSFVPRVMLSSEGGDVVDKLPSFLSRCWGGSEAGHPEGPQQSRAELADPFINVHFLHPHCFLGSSQITRLNPNPRFGARLRESPSRGHADCHPHRAPGSSGSQRHAGLAPGANHGGNRDFIPRGGGTDGPSRGGRYRIQLRAEKAPLVAGGGLGWQESGKSWRWPGEGAARGGTCVEVKCILEENQ